MLPFRTILVPTDFSEHSELAFRLACSLARDTGARIIALHVLAPPIIGYGDGIYVPMPAVCPRESEEKLLALEAPTPNVTVEHRMVEGEPVTEILNAAQESSCDLILIGTHGRSGIKHLLMGSVAEKVVRKATCPVMTVKAQPAKKGARKGRTLELQNATTAETK